jgi:hypothetical protein
LLVALKKNHACLYDKKVTSIAHHDRCHNHVVSPVCHDATFNSHAMFASSSSYAHGRNRPRRHYVASHAPRRASTGPTVGGLRLPKVLKNMINNVSQA